MTKWQERQPGALVMTVEWQDLRTFEQEVLHQEGRSAAGGDRREEHRPDLHSLVPRL